MEMVLGVGAGAVAATAFTPMLIGGISKMWAGAANPSLKPLWTLVTGGIAAAVAGALFRRGKIGTYMLVGGGVAATIDLLNQYIVPMLPGFAGYGTPYQVEAGIMGYGGGGRMGDYVQLPYSGMGQPMGDYVQLPYSGMGTPQQVEAGMMGYGDDSTGTFAQSF